MVAYMRITLALTLLLTGLAPVWAQDEAAAPPPAPAADQPAAAAPPAANDKLVVTVVSVEGQVHYMDTTAAEPKWLPAKAGMTLNEKSMVRTGFGSKAVLKFADRGEVAINNGTKIGISEFAKKQTATKVRVGLKYGSGIAKVRHPVSTALTDFRIEAPAASAAATHSETGFGQNGDTGFAVAPTESTWTASGPQGRQNYGPGQPGSGKRNDPKNTIQNRLATFVGDIFGGLTPTEMNNFATNGGGRNVFGSAPGPGLFSASNSTVLTSGGSNLATWAGGGTYVKCTSQCGYWAGSGAYSHASAAGYWTGGGTYRVSSGAIEGRFRATMTGSGLYQAAGRNTIQTWVGTGSVTGIGTEDHQHPGTGTWVGTGTGTGTSGSPSRTGS